VSAQATISGRAEADLAHQYRWYLDHAGVEVAERYLAAFNATLSRLMTRPGLGRTRRFRAAELAGLRSLPVGGRFGVHVIFYRVVGRSLSVERVMHGARNLPRRLLEQPGAS
jgi:plasmid stabilization system protein ParE